MSESGSVDLRELLDVPADDIKKPPVWPAGTYYGFIDKYETGKTEKKGTKFVRVIVKCMRADDSLIAANQDFFNTTDVSKRTFRKDFYIMPDKSQHWRLKEMLEAIGVSTEGRSLLAAIPEMQGKPVKFILGQRPNSDNTELFNEIADSTISKVD